MKRATSGLSFSIKSGDRETRFEGFAEIHKVTLSDGTEIQGDGLPKMDIKSVMNWLGEAPQEAQVATAEQAYDVIQRVAENKLTRSDAAVLMQRVIQGQQLDGMLAWRLVHVGLSFQKWWQRSQGGKRSKLTPEKECALPELIVQHDLSISDIYENLERQGLPVSKTTISVRRKKVAETK